jgi:ubiquinone/menaquinone biosynthesis C-methylase UbiE
MLHDFLEAIPDIRVAGLDISDYVVTNAIEKVRPYLCVGNCTALPYADNSFDLVVSIATIHNPGLDDVKVALKEIERVSSKHKFIKVGAYRNEEEKDRLDKWNVVANTFMFCHEWESLFEDVGYTGDYTWFTP